MNIDEFIANGSISIGVHGWDRPRFNIYVNDSRCEHFICYMEIAYDELDDTVGIKVANHIRHVEEHGDTLIKLRPDDVLKLSGVLREKIEAIDSPACRFSGG